MRSSFGPRSMACVYMLRLLTSGACRRRAAPCRPACARSNRAARRRPCADADQRLDAVLQFVRHGVAVGVAVLGRQFAPHLHLVEQPLARDHQLVLARELAVLQHQFLDLRREHVDAADDQHVVAAADDLAHAAHAARGGRQQARQVARAVADDRQRFLGQRGEDEFAFAAVGQHLAGLGVDDLGVEVVFPDHRAVLGLDALVGHARAHHLAQAVDVDRVDVGADLDVAPHRLGPGFGAEDADAHRHLRAGPAPGAGTPRRSPACSSA